MTTKYRQTAFRLSEPSLAALDRAAKERGLTRNGMIEYLCQALEKETILIVDPTTIGKLKDFLLEQVARTARVTARKETRLVLTEEGFTTTRFER